MIKSREFLCESIGASNVINVPKNILNESISKSASGIITIDTLLSTADEKNGNGRIYPYSVLKEAVNNYIDYGKTIELYGSLDHYDDAEVKWETVSHLIKDLWWKGNKLYGQLEILDFPEIPRGQLAGKILKLGKRVGISSRSLGNTIQRGDDIIVESLDIIAYDLVTRPSNNGSILNNIQESIVSFDQNLEENSKIKSIFEKFLI